MANEVAAQGLPSRACQSVATPVAKREPVRQQPRWYQQEAGPPPGAAAAAAAAPAPCTGVAGGGVGSGSGTHSSLRTVSSLDTSACGISSGATSGSCPSGGSSAGAAPPVPATPLARPDRLHGATVSPALPAAPPLRLDGGILGAARQQEEQHGRPAKEACTPRAAWSGQLGTPLSSPAPPRTTLSAASMYTTPLGTPRCSSASSNAAARPTSALLSPLSPRSLRGIRPCSVKLTGSVRLVGNKIIPLPARSPPAKPFASASASGSTSQPEGPPGRLELSPADPLSPPVQGVHSSGGTPASASIGTAPQLTPAKRPLRIATRPELSMSVMAEMAASPVKRARPRKSHAPARAAAGDEEAAAGAASAPAGDGALQGPHAASAKRGAGGEGESEGGPAGSGSGGDCDSHRPQRTKATRRV